MTYMQFDEHTNDQGYLIYLPETGKFLDCTSGFISTVSQASWAERFYNLLDAQDALALAQQAFKEDYNEDEPMEILPFKSFGTLTFEIGRKES